MAALSNESYISGHWHKPKGIKISETMMIDGELHRTHRIVAHEFVVFEIDEPDLHMAQQLIEWENSEQGRWVMAKAIDSPVWHRQIDYLTLGYSYRVTAYLRGVDYTFWQLKYNQIT